MLCYLLSSIPHSQLWAGMWLPPRERERQTERVTVSNLTVLWDGTLGGFCGVGCQLLPMTVAVSIGAEKAGPLFHTGHSRGALKTSELIAEIVSAVQSRLNN